MYHKLRKVQETKRFNRKLEKKLMIETYEEVKRSGKWKLIFPSYHCYYYKQFIEVNRKKNEMLIKLISRNIKNIAMDDN